MSSFICDVCGVECIDTEVGYATGCDHYPADHGAVIAYRLRQFAEKLESAKRGGVVKHHQCSQCKTKFPVEFVVADFAMTRYVRCQCGSRERVVHRP
jgi:hypothetical protein